MKSTIRKPRGRPLESQDHRRNQHGQRNAAAVATAREIRDLYVRVLAETSGQDVQPNPSISNLEQVVRRHVALALAGDERARETMLDRIWGRPSG